MRRKISVGTVEQDQVRSFARHPYGSQPIGTGRGKGKWDMNSVLTEDRLNEINYGASPCPLWKRSLDILVIILSLPVVLPISFCIATLIRLVSDGPVLFKQQRVGYMGRRFTCYKFRTMYVNADTGVHEGYLDHLINSNLPMEKMDSKGDRRLIPFGLLLRSCGLDELPQLINVWRGDMSAIGPRPCLPNEYEKYLPWQRERFTTLPGLTGLWQVSGKNRTTFLEMINLDIRYAREKTLWLDLAIIAKTLPVLIGQLLETGKKAK